MSSLYERALAAIPGGVDSPVRSFASVGGEPFFVARAEGPYLVDTDGRRYVDYVHDSCTRVAAAAGAPTFSLGYQNHSNRPLEWTQPDISAKIDRLADDGITDVVVDAISFMHEQSETLAELDHELRAHAGARGLRFHRVPVPFDDPAIITVLADLVLPFAGENPRAGGTMRANAGGGTDADAIRRAALSTMRPCVCRPTACTFCLNRV